MPRPAEARRPVQALVGVRTVEEALLAAQAGVTMIDLTEPRAGALGALPLPLLREIVAALRARDCTAELAAAVGEVSVEDVRHRVEEAAACGVDVVKVGLWPAASARAQLAELARLMQDTPLRIVPVLMAEPLFNDVLLGAACEAPFAALMVDTQDKSAGSLLDRLPPLDLRRFIARARAAGRRVGLAGALRLADVPRLKALRPDFAGFRSAVCDGGRTGPLNAEALRQLLASLREGSAATV